MRTFICAILLFFTFNASAQKFTIVQFNAKWNDGHTVKIPNIKGVDVKFALLEDQPKHIREKIKSVPLIILYRDGQPVKQWNADLSFKLNITEEDILRALFEASK